MLDHDTKKMPAMMPDNKPDSPARGRSKKIEIGLDEGLYNQVHQYAQTNHIALGILIRAWLRQQTDPKRHADLPYGVARELGIAVTRKVEVRLEPELLEQAQRYARQRLVPLAPLVRAWLRYHTNPRSPGPVPAGVKEERKRPSRRKQK